MRRVNSVLGFAPGAFQAFLGPRIPWTRPGWTARQKDARFFPLKGGGRRLVHPYLPDILYPEIPRTDGFDYDVLRTVKSVLTRTEGGTALIRYPDFRDDVVITETFNAGGDLKTTVDLFRQLYEYLQTPLPDGDYLGWHCPDLSPYFYAIELIDVKLGNGTGYHLEEIGSEQPYMTTEPLQIMFKFITEAKAPAGVLTFTGA
jgi:hypothetical protein